jgi:hypothetical protein
LEVGGHFELKEECRFVSIPAHWGVSKSTIRAAVELTSLLLYTSTIAQNGTSMGLLWTLCEDEGSTSGLSAENIGGSV